MVVVWDSVANATMEIRPCFVPQKSMVESEILKFGDAEEKMEKMNTKSELKKREKGENGESL